MFSSVEEECCYYKEKALKYYQEKLDGQQELEDFTEESRQLEAELEAQIEQDENQIRTLKNNLNQLQIETESQRKKIITYENEIHSLEQQHNNIVAELENQKIYIRELEQKNDDLERAHRIVTESVVGIETMLNAAYEKNALLEMEVDEKELLQVKLQRLMDEARDLKQELNVKNRSSTGPLDNTDKLLNNHIENHFEIETTTTNTNTAPTTVAPQVTPRTKLTSAVTLPTTNGTSIGVGGGGGGVQNPIKRKIFQAFTVTRRALGITKSSKKQERSK